MSRRKPGPRPAVVGTCTLSPQNSADADELLRTGLEMVDRMAAGAAENGWQLDMFLLPEHSSPVEHDDARAIAETLDGKTVTAFAQKARQHGTYGAVPLHLIEDGGVSNCIVILGRDGEPAGIYRKVFPVVMPDGTLERGVTPGGEFPVFELDFGRVGVQICFDASFPDGWEAYAEQEAELVLFSTDPPAGLAVCGYACRHEYTSSHRPCGRRRWSWTRRGGRWSARTPTARCSSPASTWTTASCPPGTPGRGARTSRRSTATGSCRTGRPWAGACC